MSPEPSWASNDTKVGARATLMNVILQALALTLLAYLLPLAVMLVLSGCSV
jgi:hypothetical protein